MLLLILAISFAQSDGPSITNVKCEDITFESMAINWDTDSISTSIIYFGNNATNTTFNESLNYNSSTHSISLINLMPKTSYFFYAYSCSENGCSQSMVYDCKTLSLEAPNITNVEINSIGENFASIVFDVNPRSDGSIMWGNSDDYRYWLNDSLVWSNHGFKISDLIPGNTYYFKVGACYIGGCNVSKEYSFKTLPDKTPPTVLYSYPNWLQTTTDDQIDMGIVTNEPSECKYSNISTLGYYIKPFGFDNASNTNHTKTITVESFTNYTFYVKCADIYGNPMEEDYIISFGMGNVTRNKLILGNKTAANNTKNNSRLMNQNNTQIENNSASSSNDTVISNPKQLPYMEYAPLGAALIFSLVLFFGWKYFKTKRKPKEKAQTEEKPEESDSGKSPDGQLPETPTDEKSSENGGSESTVATAATEIAPTTNKAASKEKSVEANPPSKPEVAGNAQKQGEDTKAKLPEKQIEAKPAKLNPSIPPEKPIEEKAIEGKPIDALAQASPKISVPSKPEIKSPKKTKSAMKIPSP